MDATTWQIISIVGYSLAGALLITAIVLFFKMKVPAIIGDLTGRTAAKQIQEIREHRGNKRHQPNVFDVDPGILWEPAGSAGLERVSRPKGKTADHSRPIVLGSLPTEVLEPHEGYLYPGDFSESGSFETEVLVEETDVLVDDETVSAVEKEERYSLTDMLVDGQKGHSTENEESYSLTDVLSDSREGQPVEKEERYSLTDVLSDGREGQRFEKEERYSLTDVLADGKKELPIEKEEQYSLTDVLNAEKKSISTKKEGRFAATGGPANERVAPLSLTEILGSYKEGVPQTADVGNELLLSLTEVLSNEKESPGSKEREVLLSLTEILSTEKGKPSDSVEVPKEVLLSLTEILSKSTKVQSASTEMNSLSVSKEVLRPRTEVLSDKKEDQRPRTDVLTNETEILDYGTELLAKDPETTVLYPTAELENETEQDATVVSFKIVKDIKVTHTNKMI